MTIKQRLAPHLLAYFRFFARYSLARVQPEIVGVTGSAGKTSTRNAVAALLKDSFRVKVSLKANSESGIPLNILGLHPKSYSPIDWLRLVLLAPIKAFLSTKSYDVYVVEMGIDSPVPPKNMEYLLTILQPNVGVLLNALPVHSEAFDVATTMIGQSDRRELVMDAIAREKSKLIQAIPEDGLAIVNADDGHVFKYASNLAAPLLLFGESNQASLHIDSVERTADSTTFHFHYQDQRATLKMPYVLPDHFAHTFAAALAVGHYFNMDIIQGCRSLQENFSLPAGRASLLKGVNNSTIIDSSYNASAEPTIDMIHLLQSYPAKRKLILLGDMRELGNEAQEEHERVLAAAFSVTDSVYVVGPLMKAYGLPYAATLGKTITWFPNSRQAGDALASILLPDDVILIKGSQNTILTEIAVERLLRNKEDVARLCRRGTYWNKQRKKIQ